jgi:hypothetical protein
MALLTTMADIRPRRMALYRWILGLIGVALLGFAAPTLSAQTEPSAEYKLKAVFLFNFAQFVEWPAWVFHTNDTPLVIGILGDDPFGAYLDDLVNGEKIGDRHLVVQRYKRAEDIKDCHILFISSSESGDLEDILAHLHDRNILTVGDTDSFTRRGGMVRFVTESGKIRLRINLEAATDSGLTISSKLLRAATVVKRGKD